MNKNILVVLGLVLMAGCSSSTRVETTPPPMSTGRMISERDCSKPIDAKGGNLLCRELTEADRRAAREEEERLARERREAAERAERERLERERAAEEAARKARLAEEERLAAERRRREAEAAAAAAAAAEAERLRLAKLEEERLARERAEREAREAAERECRRLEQERSEGRAMLASFVAKYGNLDEFREIAGQIRAFLDKPREAKPCPPA